MVLKRGDKNDLVKQLQQKIGLEAGAGAGIFGPKTEDALKAWQKANGLTADGVAGPATLAKLGIVVAEAAKPAATAPKPTTGNLYSKERIEAAVTAKGYKWFGDKDMMLNIVGVRNSATGNAVTNLFDDRITVSYMDGGVWKYHEWVNTTDPGKKGVKEYHNAAGVARLVEGQYIGSHTLGLHQGKYEALKQAKPVKVYRDANRDMTYDENKVAEGVFGINIHKAGADSTYVENWSEGCQVFKKAADFEAFMAICRKAAAIHGKSFTYTLIESADIK